ncbi:MAG TPA: hypothetical protein VG267_10005 [Terracidiphilus sp.]|jgi:hypothetical protein|nr:hypothetical protein [Terracidiphilus sp.]
METYLRPMGLGEILDRTAQLYRTHFLLFAGIFAAYAGISLLLSVAGLGLKLVLAGNSLMTVTLVMRVLQAAALLLLVAAPIAAISRAVATAHLGEKVTIRGAYASTLPKFWRYLWLMTIMFFIAWLPFILLYAAFFGVLAAFKVFQAGGGHTNPEGTMVVGIAGLVFLLLFFPVMIYTVWMSLRYSLGVPAAVVEDLTAWKAIKRSVELSKGARGRIFLLLLLVGVIKFATVALTQSFVFVSAFHHRQLSVGLTALSQVIGFFTNSFLGPIGATGVTLFYFDQRVRKEGYDIEWMMQAAGLGQGAVPAQAGDETALPGPLQPGERA